MEEVVLLFSRDPKGSADVPRSPSGRGYSQSSKQYYVPIVPDIHRAQANVHVREAHGEQAHPGPEGVAAVQGAALPVHALAGRGLGDAVLAAAENVPQRM